MRNGLNNDFGIKGCLVATLAVVLLSGYAVTPSDGQKERFETDFESEVVPACGSEEVKIKGTATFTFIEKEDADGNVRQVAVVKNKAVGEGVLSGTQYKIHEKEEQVILVEGGDTTFDTDIKGSFKGEGSEVNTQVRIKLVTVIHEDGSVETIVNDVEVKCS
jgi:hypothetical protein